MLILCLQDVAIMTTKDSWTKRINILTLNRLEEQFNLLYKQSRYKEAEEVIEQAVLLAKDTYGPKHPYYSACLNNRALVRKKLDGNQLGCLNLTDSLSKRFDYLTKGWKGKLIVCLSIAIVAVSGAIFGTMNLQKGEASRGVAIVPLEGEQFPLYKVKASFNPDDRTIQGEEEIFFKTQGKGNELLLNLYFNRYNDKALCSSEMRQYAFAKGEDQGYIDILSVSHKGKPLKFMEEGEVLRVSLDETSSFSSDEGLKIDFKLKIPYIADRSGANDKGIWLGNWLPTLAVKKNLHKATEIGDDFVNLSSTYKLSFYVPQGYNLVLSNIQDVQPRGNGRIYNCNLERVRDLPVFINKGYKQQVVKAGQTEIHYYYLSDDARPLEVLEMASQALDYYNNYVGKYPWKQLNIVENDMYLSGMEYSTMILLSSKAIKNSMEETVFHEVGHQWFYNIIGSDQYSAPFIDEGLVEFFGYYVLKRQIPQTWQQTSGLNKDLSQFSTWKQYREVHYQNGRKMFENLFLVMGKTEFEKFIKEYYDKYKFSLVTYDEFKTFLTEKVGQQQATRLLNY